MTMKNTPLPPSADNAIARTIRFVAAAAASLLIVGPDDVGAWNLASCSDGLCYGGAALSVAWVLLVLAVLLTPAALVWVTRLFIRAVRPSMPPPTLAERPVARTAPSVGAAAEPLLVVVGLLLAVGLLYSSYGGAALIAAVTVAWALGVLAALLTLAAPVWVTRHFIRREDRVSVTSRYLAAGRNVCVALLVGAMGYLCYALLIQPIYYAVTYNGVHVCLAENFDQKTSRCTQDDSTIKDTQIAHTYVSYAGPKEGRFTLFIMCYFSGGWYQVGQVTQDTQVGSHVLAVRLSQIFNRGCSWWPEYPYTFAVYNGQQEYPYNGQTAVYSGQLPLNVQCTGTDRWVQYCTHS